MPRDMGFSDAYCQPADSPGNRYPGVQLVDLGGDHDRDIFLAQGTSNFSGRQSRILINDGHVDIIVANLGAEQLLFNGVQGHFVDASAVRLPLPSHGVILTVMAIWWSPMRVRIMS